MTEDEDWNQNAECLDVDPDVFFPKLRSGPHKKHEPEDDEYAEARAICAACPVAEQCKAAHPRERWGMWWGSTPQDRGFGRSGKLNGAEVEETVSCRDAVRIALETHSGSFTRRTMQSWLAGRYSESNVSMTLRRMAEAGELETVERLPSLEWVYAPPAMAA